MWMLIVAATLDAATLAGVMRDAAINAVAELMEPPGLPAYDQKLGREPLAGKRRVPCFPDKPKLDAADMLDDLSRFREYRYSTDEPPPPKGTYGRCRVRDGVVYERDGTPVARLHCGMSVLVRGISDPLRHEIGASGADILANHSGMPIVCVYGGPVRSRCWFATDDTDEPKVHYEMHGVVLGDIVTGDAAREFFASSTLVGFMMRGSCH